MKINRKVISDHCNEITDDGVEESDEGEEGDEAGGDVEHEHDCGGGSLRSRVQNVDLFAPVKLDVSDGRLGLFCFGIWK